MTTGMREVQAGVSLGGAGGSRGRKQGLRMSLWHTKTSRRLDRRQVQLRLGLAAARPWSRDLAAPMDGAAKPIAAKGRIRLTSSHRDCRRTRSPSRRCSARSCRATERVKARRTRMPMTRAVFALTYSIVRSIIAAGKSAGYRTTRHRRRLFHGS